MADNTKYKLEIPEGYEVNANGQLGRKINGVFVIRPPLGDFANTALAVMDGIKVRQKSWDEHKYIYRLNDLIVDQDGNNYTLSDYDILIAEDWEFIPE